MDYLNFTIKNYKGINDLSIDFSREPISKIVTMVGLNESGKTTILEALFFFYENIGKEDEITLHRGVVDSIHKIIPKRLKDNFNDTVEISAQLHIEQSDQALLSKEIKKEGVDVKFTGDILKLKHVYAFKNSKNSGQNKYWTIPIEVKTKGERKYHRLRVFRPEWKVVVNALKAFIPPIIYYPNFLFEFPTKIYLSQIEGESIEQEFYRRLIQDILDSIGNGLKIEQHLIARAESNEVGDRDALDIVINKMKVRVSDLIFSPELSVFQNKNTSKSISFSLPKKDPSNSAYYIEIKIHDGEDSFNIDERSLGFRWFFTFLLFTQYRVRRINGGGKPVFLFDEPASNLHQTAQQRLLKAFEDLASKFGAAIIYTTHSHHLINPKWLENTFIVQNTALNYNDDSSYSAIMTDIKALRYREFVGKYPDQRTYFQPILDVLEYKPSDLENIPAVIMVEGKNDFYTLKYISELYLDTKLPLLPGGGAGTLDSVIQLYIAWGRRFIILLDNDGEGEKQKKRYIEKYGKILETKITSLPTIQGKSTNIRIENIFTKDDQLRIQSTIDDFKIFDKKKFFLSIQDLLVNNKKVDLEEDTLGTFTEIFKILGQMLAQNMN